MVVTRVAQEKSGEGDGDGVIKGSVDLVKDFEVYPKNCGKPLDGFKHDMTRYIFRFEKITLDWNGAKTPCSPGEKTG